MNFELKDKIEVTDDYIKELEIKSWQEIEHIQTQLNNLEEGPLKALLNTLLTGYYVFVGGLESLCDLKSIAAQKTIAEPNINMTRKQQDIAEEPLISSTVEPGLKFETEIEPFEYFVDFDEPVGTPISDADLYGI